MPSVVLPPPRDRHEEEKRAWIRQLDPRSPDEMLADLAKLRSLEGVTEQSKRIALETAKQQLDFDDEALLDLCRSRPAIRSAAFYGGVMANSPSFFHILFDFNEALLPPNHNMLCVLGELDEEFMKVFNRRPDSTDYGMIEYSIRHAGHDGGVAENAQVFYAV